MEQYLNTLSEIYTDAQRIIDNRDTRHGTVYRGDRTGTGTYGIFGTQWGFDLTKWFPLLTTKRVSVESVINELLWFLTGSTNTNDLPSKIWDEWAIESGDLGPVYGKLWTSWPDYDGGYVNQISDLVTNLKNNPYSRRHVVSAWCPPLLPDESVSPQENVRNGRQALAPCHCLFQMYVAPATARDKVMNFRMTYPYPNNLGSAGIKSYADGLNYIIKEYPEFDIPVNTISCKVYQRSADIFLGVPFNIASYSLLTTMIAHVCGFAIGKLYYSFGDLHLYSNHLEQAALQLSREPGPLPSVTINPKVKDIFEIRRDDITIHCYNPQPSIMAPVSI